MSRKRSISHLKVGETVDLRFHGSKQLGNAPYTIENCTVIDTHGEGDARIIKFDEVEVYRYSNRWAYGTSAERVSIL